MILIKQCLKITAVLLKQLPQALFYAEQLMLRNVKSFARYGRFINMFVQNYEVDF